MSGCPGKTSDKGTAKFEGLTLKETHTGGAQTMAIGEHQHQQQRGGERGQVSAPLRSVYGEAFFER